MTVAINLDNKTIEELEQYKSVIENKIAEKKTRKKRVKKIGK